MAALWRIFSAPVKVGVEVWTEPGKSLIDYLIKFQKLTLSVGVVLSQGGGGEVGMGEGRLVGGGSSGTKRSWG